MYIYACFATQIAVEGNIASGKSTLLKKLSQLNGVEVRVSFVVQMFIAITPQQVLIEPVDKWRNLSGGNVIVSGQKWLFFFLACYLTAYVHRAACMRTPRGGGTCSSRTSS